MKKILLIAGVLVVLLGGAGGGYLYISNQAMAEDVAEDTTHGDDHGEKKGKGQQTPAVFVQLDALILPVVESSGISQTVSLVVVLEASGSAAADKIKNLSPRLKDAFIQDMYGMLHGPQMRANGGIIPVAEIKSRMLSISREILGAETVKDVLLQVVQQRPS